MELASVDKSSYRGGRRLASPAESELGRARGTRAAARITVNVNYEKA